jgi:hypothetical protein
MPQLEIKAPTLVRWGKKIAVVIDRPFWDSLGPMVEEKHASNCDIAWFVVGYEDTGERLTLARDSVHFTTLQHAVAGLTGGIPPSKEDFEERLRSKLAAHSSH